MPQTLIVDPARCTGCRSCETACSTFREGESNLFKCRIKVVRFPEEFFFYPLVCQQCETPLCAVPCPTAALKKDGRTGLVEFIREKCVGCKMCLTACPFGAISLVDGYPVKCDLCAGEPACTRRFITAYSIRWTSSWACCSTTFATAKNFAPIH